MKIQDIEKLYELGFICIPIKDNKAPLFDLNLIKKTHSIENFNNLRPSNHHAIMTGFNDLEVVDIDRVDNIDGILKKLRINITDFEKKVVVKTTRSGGIHLLYQNGKVEGNRRLTNQIDIKGNKGYICMYGSYSDYNHIQYITDLERKTIFDICQNSQATDIETCCNAICDEKVHSEKSVYCKFHASMY